MMPEYFFAVLSVVFAFAVCFYLVGSLITWVCDLLADIAWYRSKKRWQRKQADRSGEVKYKGAGR